MIPNQNLLQEDDVILVTGGHGLFGRGIQHAQKTSQCKGNWIYLSSKDGDLRDAQQCKALFDKYKPTYVIHLAAFVGGLFHNMNNKFWLDNVNMNNNVLMECNRLQVKKCVSCLSTCIFPDKVDSYPITEQVLHNGPPHDSNNAYAYAKRMLDYLGRWLNESNPDHPNRFVSVIPTNLFGPYDNFNIKNGHVLPGLIHKCYLARQNNENLTVYGTGKPLRQFLYSYDAGHLMIWALLNYKNGQEPVIISTSEQDEVTIAQAVDAIVKHFPQFHGKVVYDTTKSDGQYKKTASNSKLMELYPDFKFTPFEQGVKETISWFVEHYDTTVRK